MLALARMAIPPDHVRLPGTVGLDRAGAAYALRRTGCSTIGAATCAAF